LLLEGDDLPGLGKGRKDVAERSTDGRSAAVKQDQRRIFFRPRDP